MERDLKNLEKEFKVKNIRDLWVGVILYINGIIIIVGSLGLYFTILSQVLSHGYFELFLLGCHVFDLLLIIIGMIYPYRNRI